MVRAPGRGGRLLGVSELARHGRRRVAARGAACTACGGDNVQVVASALYAFDGGGAEVARSTTHTDLLGAWSHGVYTIFRERGGESDVTLLITLALRLARNMCVRCFL